MSQKISIRFYNDREVRAVWSEEQGEWFFAIVDIITAITGSESPRKYWSVLKTRLKRQGNELATNCSQLKLMDADSSRIKALLAGALTDDITSREMFMKGIDYSYYYEQED